LFGLEWWISAVCFLRAAQAAHAAAVQAATVAVVRDGFAVVASIVAGEQAEIAAVVRAGLPVQAAIVAAEQDGFVVGAQAAIVAEEPAASVVAVPAG
jgi:hypothetical protein